MAAASASSSFLFFTIILLTTCSQARAKEFLVGGKPNAWKIPSSTSDSLNKWAEATRFRVGDSLLWQYDSEKDSVLLVTREAYMSCNAANPVEEHKGGENSVKLERSGVYYFISGAAGACEQGEKVIVVVMSEKHSLRGLAPAPSPTSYDGRAVAPTSGAAGGAVLKSVVVAALVFFSVVFGFAL